jgi:hypothetical protein
MNTTSWAKSGTPPADCRRGDPGIGVVMPLMQGVADPAALIAKLGHALDGLSVHGQHRHVGGHRAEFGYPSRSGARLQLRIGPRQPSGA